MAAIIVNKMRLPPHPPCPPGNSRYVNGDQSATGERGFTRPNKGDLLFLLLLLLFADTFFGAILPRWIIPVPDGSGSVSRSRRRSE